MRKYFAIIPLVIMALLPSGMQALAEHNVAQPQASGTVYICTGSGAYAYHRSRSCGGLNKCKATIVTTSESDARSKGRKACGKCY